MASEAGASAGSLSEGLLRLQAEPAGTQAQWWREVAAGLDPSVLQASIVEVDYDTLGRFFDGTALGIDFTVERVTGEERHQQQQHEGGEEAGSGLGTEAFREVLANQYGFLGGGGDGLPRHEEATAEEAAFRRLCERVFDAGARTTSRASLRHVVRQLRIGALLGGAAGAPQEGLYHYDYTAGTIGGSFVASAGTEVRFRRGAGWRSVPVVARQKALGSSVDEYLFTEPARWPDGVHWVHAHRPGKELLLALGQLHELHIHDQGTLCRLKGARPQHNFHHGNRPKSRPCGSPRWHLLLFPAVTLDGAARRSLEQNRAWRASKAKAGQTREDVLPPPVEIGVVHQNLAVLWSGEQSGGTVFTVAGKAEYIGRWSSATPHHRQARALESVLAACCCCRRRSSLREKGGYELLAQNEEEADARDDAEVLEQIRVDQGLSEADKVASFEQTFRGVLLQLDQENSLLRMGTHGQLACRIILNAASECLDVINLYKAAVSRTQLLLGEKEQPHKQQLIGRVSAAKLELNSLLQMIEPIVEFVLPDALSIFSVGDVDSDLSARIRWHHLVDIENDLRQFLQQCRSEIQLCESIIAEYDRRNNDKVNNILNFLTIITFCVMPVQILTGVYGMNFERMPELKWNYGYPHYFFLCCLVGTTSAATLMMCIYRSVT